MKYSRFESLAFILGLGIVGVTTFALIRAHQELPEIIGQILLLFVLLGALHYGRNGGIVTFLIASTIYLLLRLPMISTSGLEGSTGYIVIRLLLFALVGILGGEITSRIKYVLLSFEHHDYVDPVTLLYNARFFGSLVNKSIAHYDRSKKPFSILTVEMYEIALGNQPSLKDKRLQEIGKAIRNNLRVLDEVGRTNDREISVILVDTPREGAEIVKERMLVVLGRLVKQFGHEIPIEVLAKFDTLTYPDDSERILAEFPPVQLTPEPVPTVLPPAEPEVPVEEEYVKEITE
jgi:diguanylate cyclase (GGDEF)-like protein